MPGFTYGPDGLLGCATPQANYTVEPELRRSLPATVNLQMVRSIGKGDSRTRLLTYFRELETTIERFGSMPLDAFGFACTASSYLLEPGEEDEQRQQLEHRFGYPVRTAAAAVNRALQRLGIQRLLIASPYPGWIHQACIGYWESAGFIIAGETTAEAGMGDTRTIYTLDAHQVADHCVTRLAGTASQADALLITGTGLPTLPIRQRLQVELGLPVISANLCLAWDLLETIKPGSNVAQHLERSLKDASHPL